MTMQDSLKAREWGQPTATGRFDRYGSGRLTGSAVLTLGGVQDGETGSPLPLYSAFYYDDRGRTIQTRAMNHIGGWDTEALEYSFTGMPLKRIQHHSDTDSSFAETSTYSYDNMDRILTVTHRLDGCEPVTVSDLSYNMLGRVASEKRNGKPELATVFSYNIRFWLTAAEGNTSRPAEALSMEYDGNRLAAVSDSGTARDKALRRKTARLSTSQEDFSYDANGNLTSDLTAGIAAASYNSLNLPRSFSMVTESGTAETRYLYDTDGRKLRQSQFLPIYTYMEKKLQMNWCINMNNPYTIRGVI